MIGSLYFLIGLKEQKGKLWYPKPPLCHWGCWSIHCHYWKPISATWQKAKTLLFCCCCCKSKDILSYYHHRHCRSPRPQGYATEALVSTAAMPPLPEPEQVAPCCGGCCVFAATAPCGTLPEQDLKSLDFCCLRNQPGGLTSFLQSSNMPSVSSIGRI